MSTTLSELEDLIYDWLLDVTGREVVSAGYNESGVPSVPYCASEIKDTNPLDHPVVKLSADGLTESIETLKTFSVKIQLIGGNAATSIGRVTASVWSTARHFDLWTVAGLGGLTPSIDLTKLETGKLRQRWETKLTLYATIKDDFTGEYEESFSLTVNENDKGLIYSEDQPIDPKQGC